MIHIKTFRWLCIPLLLFAWFNPITDSALSVLEDDAAKGMESLAIMESIYLMAKSGASVNIPLVSGTFDGSAETMQTAISYLSISNVAIVTNLLLMKLAHAKIIVLALALVWVASWWGKHERFLLKILMVGFLVNPGLDLYTLAIAQLDKEVKFDQQDTLHDQIQLVHNDFEKKEAMRKKELEARKEKQLEKNKAKGKDHLTFGQKIEDAVAGVSSSAALHVAEDYRLTKQAVKFAAQKSLELVLNAFTSVIFMYILLPLGYLWMAYHLISYLFATRIFEAEQVNSVVKQQLKKAA